MPTALRGPSRTARPHATRTRPFLRAVILVVLVLVIAPTSHASDVTVVLSSSSAHYKAAAEACAEELRKDGRKAEIVTIGDDDAEDKLTGAGAVVSIGAGASRLMVQRLGDGVPLYYCLAPNPASLGLTQRPDTSGVSADVPYNQQIELIREAVPDADRLGVLYRSTSEESSARVEAIRENLPRDITLVTVDLDEDAARSKVEAIRALLNRDVDVVWMLPDHDVYDTAMVKATLLEALRNRVPVFGFSGPVVRAGALAGVSVDPADQGRRAAEMLIQESRGVHESATPRRAINLVVADRIGHEIPRSLVRIAAEVYGEKERGR